MFIIGKIEKEELMFIYLYLIIMYVICPNVDLDTCLWFYKIHKCLE
jgi:hypothetical protein